jgi:aspartate aminotransferase
MPTPSNRAAHIPASPIRRLVPLSDAARARGVRVHHLNIGQPDIETPPSMLEAFRRFDAPVLAYGPSQGIPELRAAVADYFTRHGDPVTAEQVFVTTGGSEALLFAFAAVADPGDTILVPEPFYANYAGFAAMLGVHVAPIPTHAEDGFHLPEDAVLEAALVDGAKAVVLANPGNPTGTVYRPEELERLGAFCRAHDLYLIADEVYREFVYDADTRFVSALSLAGAEGRVIITDSVSKRFSACGARIGFVVSRSPELCDVFRRLGFARLCPATVAQQVALAGYRLDPSYFGPVIDEYRRRRDALVDGLNAIPGVWTYRPEGAFYTVVTLPVEDADHFCAWLLTDFQHEGETVMMAPASGFYAEPERGRHQARIAYVLDVAALEASVRILRAALEVYPGVTGRGPSA